VKATPVVGKVTHPDTETSALVEYICFNHSEGFGFTVF